VHDLTGGNYWAPLAIQYQDDQGALLLGGGLTADQSAALAVGAVAHLADEGDKLLEAWLATGMAEPYVMASVDLDTLPPACDNEVVEDGDGFVDWDGGGVGAPDPQCVDTPWRNSEAPRSGCGLGGEAAVAVALLGLVRRRRARR
jgi:hypothetical protein